MICGNALQLGKLIHPASVGRTGQSSTATMPWFTDANGAPIDPIYHLLHARNRPALQKRFSMAFPVIGRPVRQQRMIV